MSDNERLEHMMSNVLSSGAVGAAAVALAKREARFEAGAKKVARQRIIDDVTTFRERNKQLAGTTLADVYSQGSPMMAGLVPAPHTSALAFDFAPDAAGVAEGALSWAKESRATTFVQSLLMD